VRAWRQRGRRYGSLGVLYCVLYLVSLANGEQDPCFFKRCAWISSFRCGVLLACRQSFTPSGCSRCLSGEKSRNDVSVAGSRVPDPGLARNKYLPALPAIALLPVVK